MLLLRIIYTFWAGLVLLSATTDSSVEVPLKPVPRCPYSVPLGTFIGQLD